MTGEPRGERADLLEALARHRGFLRQTVQGLSDDQARRRTTVSELCLGGIIKHVAAVERRWAEFVVHGPSVLSPPSRAAFEAHQATFRMEETDTLTALLAGYDDAARNSDRLVAELPSLDASQPLPAAPWFEPGAEWTARRVFLHVLAETAQHAGHADVIREALDGAKTMG